MYMHLEFMGEVQNQIFIPTSLRLVLHWFTVHVLKYCVLIMFWSTEKDKKEYISKFSKPKASSQ